MRETTEDMVYVVDDDDDGYTLSTREAFDMGYAVQVPARLWRAYLAATDAAHNAGVEMMRAAVSPPTDRPQSEETA